MLWDREQLPCRGFSDGLRMRDEAPGDESTTRIEVKNIGAKYSTPMKIFHATFRTPGGTNRPKAKLNS
jgi:hypothetical protein